MRFQSPFFEPQLRASFLPDVVRKFHPSPSANCTTVNSVSETFILNGQTISIPSATTQFCGSEANQVINNFNGLSCTTQQDVINFLRSL